jgi:superfamily II DNA/RNA helicase
VRAHPSHLDVHRLGRTARAGESGEGWIILDPSEDFFLTKLGRDTIKSHPSEQFPASTIVQWQQKVDMALDAIPDDVKGQAYAVRAHSIIYKTCYLINNVSGIICLPSQLKQLA